MKLKLKIIDLDGIYLEENVDLLNINTTSGVLTILANHLPLITNIKISIMYTKNNGLEKKYSIAGGTLFVSETDCKIITSAIESSDDIDFDRAKKAKIRAEARLSSKDEDIDYKRAEIALKKALNRLSLRQ